MRPLYESMINIDSIYYLDCWILYMDLIESICINEPVEFYDWSSIEKHPNYYLLDMYKRNINDNINIIINIVEDIVRDITLDTNGYTIINDIISIGFELIKCDNCGRIWDGCTQCNCSM